MHHDGDCPGAAARFPYAPPEPDMTKERRLNSPFFAPRLRERRSTVDCLAGLGCLVIVGSSVALTFAIRLYRRISDGHRKPLARYGAYKKARFARGLLPSPT
jgi:hypothetical protein